jgi:predicted phage terminase large subunit-like protein
MNPVLLPVLPPDVSPETARQALEARAREDFRAFCHYIAAFTGRECAPDAKHHQLFCAYIQSVAAGILPGLIVNTPPGAAKSRYFALMQTAWRLGRNPERLHGLFCHTDALAEAFSRDVQNIVTSGAYQQVFPSVRLANDAAGQWLTTDGGGVYAAGVGTAIAGRRLDHLHIDDPVRSRQEAASRERMQTLWEWWVSDARTRLKPNATVTIASTRWSVDDLVGRLIDDMAHGGRKFEVVNLPMLCNDPVRDPLGRRLGERLWEEWFSAEMVEEAQRDTVTWSALYQGAPLDASGSYFDREWLHVTDDIPTAKCVSVLACDTAMTLGGGDHSVIVAGRWHRESGLLYIVDIWRAQVTSDIFIAALIDKINAHQPMDVVFDDDAAFKLLRPEIVKQARLARVRSMPVLRALSLHSRGGAGEGKQLRAATIRGMFSRGEVFLAKRGWTADLMHELLHFPSVRVHDDMVDCLSLLGRWCSQHHAIAAEREEEVEYTVHMPAGIHGDAYTRTIKVRRPVGFFTAPDTPITNHNRRIP